MYGIPEHCQPLSPAEEQVLLAVWPAARLPPGATSAKSWLPGLGPGHGAQLLVSAGKKGLGEERQGPEPQHLHPHRYPPGLRRGRHAGTAGHRLRRPDLAEAVRALVSESGCGQSELEQAMAVLAEKHAEAEEYDLYDPYG